MTPRLYEPSPAHDPEGASEPQAGVPFLHECNRCIYCGGMLTGRESVDNGFGRHCGEKHSGARFVDPRQLALPWEQEARG